MTHFVLNDLRCNTYQSRRRQRSSWPAGGPAHSAMHERERGMSISTRGSAVPYEAPRSPGFRRMFREGHLTLGLFFAIESYGLQGKPFTTIWLIAKRQSCWFLLDLCA